MKVYTLLTFTLKMVKGLSAQNIPRCYNPEHSSNQHTYKLRQFLKSLIFYVSLCHLMMFRYSVVVLYSASGMSNEHRTFVPSK